LRYRYERVANSRWLEFFGVNTEREHIDTLTWNVAAHLVRLYKIKVATITDELHISKCNKKRVFLHHTLTQALSPRTPIFTLNGMHVALRLQGGHAVQLRPTFLSITQLHAFAQVKALTRVCHQVSGIGLGVPRWVRWPAGIGK